MLENGQKKITWSPWLRLLIKVMAVLAVLYILQRVLMPKYTGTVIEGNFTEEYYQDGSAHELIVIGNCESYENISPITLWEEYGITSYIRGNSNQLIPQSYYILKETLEYEVPKVVVLNIQAMTVDEQTTEEYNRMVFDGMKWSKDKLDAIMATMMEDEELIEYIFPILRYKDRISELSLDDIYYAFFEKPVQSYYGYYLRADIRAYDESAFPYERRREDYTFSEQNMDYLERIAKLCEENDIALVLMKAPSAYPVWLEPYEEQIEAFANEHGLLYLNTLEYDEIGIDLSTDTYDGGLHLNVYGAEKISRWIGSILKETYGLNDYREDENFSGKYWERAEAYHAEKAAQAEEFEATGSISRYNNS